MSVAVAHLVEYDPVRDKSYRRARLARDVADWLAWLELGGSAPRTLDQYERDLARLCLLYPSKALEEITDGDLSHLARRFKPGERRVRMAAINSFFRWAKRTRRIGDNPTEYLPPIRRRPQRVIDTFTDAEVAQLVGLPLRDGALMRILFEAGLRKGEARALTVNRIRPEPIPGQLAILRGKGGKDRLVPLTPALSRALAELQILDGLGSRDHLWYDRPGGGTVIRRSKEIGEGSFVRWWCRCVQAAEVRYRNPHVARHTFATWWLRRGGRLETLSGVMGHASIRTTFDLYGHLDVRDAAEDLARVVGEIRL